MAEYMGGLIEDKVLKDRRESYDPKDFNENRRPWRQVLSLLSEPLDPYRSVCVGVSGAHGSGKSWLLRHAARHVNRNGGVGVYFSSPCAYDSSDFLSSLCDALATRTEANLHKKYRAAILWEVLSRRDVQFAIAAGAVGTAVLILRNLPAEQLIWLLLALLSLTYAFIAIVAALREFKRGTHPHSRLYLHALAIQTWIHYSSFKRSASEFALEAGKGIAAKGRTSEELALSERPVTELALATEFTGLVEELAYAGIRVLVAIDGFDQIEPVEDSKRLLQRIRTVLDPPGGTILVTIPDQAVTYPGAGRYLGRDGVSSSFGKILPVPALTRWEARDLVAGLVGAPIDECSDALWVLSGGNQRECKRLLEHLRPADLDSHLRVELTPTGCIDESARFETGDFLDTLVSDAVVDEQQRRFAYASACDCLHAHSQTSAARASSLLAAWTPKWIDPSPGSNTLAEHWRRLLVRDALRCVLRERVGSGPVDDSSLDTLRQAFVLSQYSASIALQIAGTVDDELRDVLKVLSPNGLSPLHGPTYYSIPSATAAVVEPTSGQCPAVAGSSGSEKESHNQ